MHTLHCFKRCVMQQTESHAHQPGERHWKPPSHTWHCECEALWTRLHAELAPLPAQRMMLCHLQALLSCLSACGCILL